MGVVVIRGSRVDGRIAGEGSGWDCGLTGIDFRLYHEAMTGKEMLRLLQANGWTVAKIKGSHHHMLKDDRKLIVPVHGKQELRKGLQESILREAGLK